ncbi:MAG: hypothetical protein HY288_07640 [Planctomycetia bacterium]|nr:hypothetical protein [Planctomycetia bacterium]
MTPEQLAELEMHLAAGTDLLTAMAAVQRDDQPQPRQPGSALWVVALGVVGLVLSVVFK